MPRRRCRRGHALALLALTAPFALVSACGSSARAPVAAVSAIKVSVSSCGQGWIGGPAGVQHLRLENTDSRPGEVQVISTRTGALFADVEPFGPGTTRDLEVGLSAGDYQLRCLMEDEAGVLSKPVSLTGVGDSDSRGVVPLTQADLIRPTKEYESYVRDRLPGLARDVDRLAAAIADRRLRLARSDWLVAHLAYERLGAAYDAFGDLDAAINGLPNGRPGGVHDPGWTGFHRIEHGLWHGASAASLAGPTARLRHDVEALRRQLQNTPIDPTTVTIRAHEITENALQFALTGKDDFGSHSGLATVRAALDGTSVVLGLLAPQLSRVGIDRATLTRAIRSADGLLDAEHRRRRWASESTLSRPDRERIDAAISELAELLAPVASALEPRRTS